MTTANITATQQPRQHCPIATVAQHHGLRIVLIDVSGESWFGYAYQLAIMPPRWWELTLAIPPGECAATDAKRARFAEFGEVLIGDKCNSRAAAYENIDAARQWIDEHAEHWC